MKRQLWTQNFFQMHIYHRIFLFHFEDCCFTITLLYKFTFAVKIGWFCETSSVDETNWRRNKCTRLHFHPAQNIRLLDVAWNLRELFPATNRWWNCRTKSLLGIKTHFHRKWSLIKCPFRCSFNRKISFLTDFVFAFRIINW